MKRSSMARKSNGTKADKMRQNIRTRKTIEKQSTKKNADCLWVPSGSIMFNLAVSDKWNGGYKTGSMVNIIGDSSAGKSIMVLSGMAMAANMPQFKDYDLFYDDAEFANSFNMPKLFGQTFTDRLQSPYKDKDDASISIEQFSDSIHTKLDAGKPFIYCLDSFDAIDSDAELKKESQNREFRKAGHFSKVKGSFQATKQKKASQIFRQICSKLKKTDSLLIIVSQTRDNLNAMSFETKYRAGGRALKFYASIEAWLAGGAPITKTINKVTHRTGVHSFGKISKNKYTGKYKTTSFPIYYDYGIDDIAACIDFILANDYWEMKKQTILASDLNMECTKAKLIVEIESQNMEELLFKAAQACWDGIEDSLKLGRKSKYV